MTRRSRRLSEREGRGRRGVERVVARAGTGTDKETLGPFRAPVTDDYYLEIPVYNDTGSVVGNSYDLDVTID